MTVSSKVANNPARFAAVRVKGWSADGMIERRALRLPRPCDLTIRGSQARTSAPAFKALSWHTASRQADGYASFDQLYNDAGLQSSDQRGRLLGLRAASCTISTWPRTRHITDHPINRIDELLPWNLGSQIKSEDKDRRMIGDHESMCFRWTVTLAGPRILDAAH